MKKEKYILLSVFLVILWGCRKQAEYSDANFHPRIFGSAFNSPSRVVNEGSSVTFGGLTFSPKPFEKTKLSWKINGEEVSTDTAYTFDSGSIGPGVYELKLEATFEGKTATRVSEIVVSPLFYTPNPYTNVVMPYLSTTATAKDVEWENVTHLAFKGARVIPDGTVDFSDANLNQTGDDIVARAHINGIPVLLGVSGTLSGVDGWSVYDNSDFGTVISDPVLMPQVVTALTDYVNARRYDGIDILMTNISLSNDAHITRNIQAVTTFLNALRVALPDAIITVTVPVNWVNGRYGDLSAATWLNVHAYENGLHTGPNAPLGHQSPLSFMIEGANIWKNKGIATDKLVIGIPAFGVRYNELDANGNNLSWSSYAYIPYKEIVGLDPDAPQNEYTDKIGHGTYYNGIPLVTQKAEYIRDNGFKGAYIWAGDYDMLGENSLIRVLSHILK